MTYYQHNTEEIAAYFRITPLQLQSDMKKSMEIGKKHDGNVPAIFEELLKTEDMSPIAKFLFVYNLGRSVSDIESKADLEQIVAEALQKGIKLGQQVPEGCQVKFTRTKDGDMKVDLEPIQTEKPQVSETKKNSEEIMYR